MKPLITTSVTTTVAWTLQAGHSKIFANTSDRPIPLPTVFRELGGDMALPFSKLNRNLNAEQKKMFTTGVGSVHPQTNYAHGPRAFEN